MMQLTAARRRGSETQVQPPSQVYTSPGNPSPVAAISNTVSGRRVRTLLFLLMHQSAKVYWVYYALSQCIVWPPFPRHLRRPHWPPPSPADAISNTVSGRRAWPLLFFTTSPQLTQISKLAANLYCGRRLRPNLCRPHWPPTSPVDAADRNEGDYDGRRA